MRHTRFVPREELLSAPNGGCFVRRFHSSVKDVETSGEERQITLATGGWSWPHNSERGTELTGRDLAEIVELLEVKLAWFGFRSVKVGPFIRVKDDTVSIDLMHRGDVLCRIQLDRPSGEWNGFDRIQRATRLL
jgi:hypothetical protein